MAILTMAVAIAANTAIFSVYDQLVLHPVSMPEPDSLVAIWFNNPQRNTQSPSISVPRFDELRREVRSFASIGLSAFDSFTLTGNGDPAQLNGMRVNATFFPTLGVMPARGRNFTADEDVPNGPLVCIISHEVWQSQFGGRPLIGATIELNGMPWEVVGIMPPRLTAPFTQVQVFAPRVFDVAGLTRQQLDAGATFAQPIARLKPATSLAQASAELAAFSRGYQSRHAARIDANNISEARPFVASLVSAFKPTMYTLLGGAGFVLLIACANVSALLVSRLLKRRQDAALRLSLGATRRVIVTESLAESAVIAGIAGIVALLLATWALNVLQPVLASQLPPSTVLTLSWRALLFAAALVGVTTLLTGALPAMQSSRYDLVEHLKDATRGSSAARGQRSRQVLIVAEVALSVVLLVGAGLLLASFIRLQRTDGGFTSTGVAASFVSVPLTRYGTPALQAQFFEQVLDSLEAQPEVEGAALGFTVPLTGSARTPYAVAGRPTPPAGQMAIVNMNIVSPDYFKLLAMPIAEGRGFTDDDRAGAPPVGIVNETFAKRVFPGQSAVGQVLVMGNGTRKVEIVGVVRDAKTAGFNQPVPEEAYFPAAQLPRPGTNVIARTTADPAALQGVIARAVSRVDPSQATSFFATFERTEQQSLGTQRLMATLTLIFAGVALSLSALGLYSVLAHVVAQRTSEIGIRMALGASRGNVIALIMGSGLWLVGLGLGVGLGVSAALGGVLRQQLFEIEPLNGAIYGAVAAIFGVAALLACLAPSLRAARVDPVIAFRSE